MSTPCGVSTVSTQKSGQTELSGGAVSKIKVKGLNNLETLLRLIAEESVSAAADSQGEAQRQKATATAIKAAKKGYFVEEEEAAAPPPAPESPAPAPEPTPEAPAETPSPTESDIGSVEFGDIKRALNNLRAGKSVEDSAVEDKLQNFVTSLKPAERKATYVIIKSISSILGGDEIPQSPLQSAKIEITSDEAQPESAPAPAGGEAPAAGSPSAPPPEEAAGGAAPPIKVGEPPVTEAFRSKIRQLIRGI